MFERKKSLGPPQNFYHLFCIQTVSTGPPAILIGKVLSSQFSAGPAISSIFIGSLFLWIIGFAIISMTYEERTNAIENIKGYMGKWSSLLFALILVMAFINWYVIEISTSIVGLNSLFNFSRLDHSSLMVSLGITLGVFAGLLALGGIQFLKWVTSIGFPFLVIYLGYIIMTSNHSILVNWKWGLPLSGIIMATFINLPGIINLPTFFRHSKSRAHSVLALTFMVIFYTFFECSSIWMDLSSSTNFIFKGSISIVPMATFLILTSTCSNLLNIYLASACYETFIPRFQNNKGHAVMGLLGTVAFYIFAGSLLRNTVFETLLNSYIAAVGIVLLISILIRMIVHHRPRPFEKRLNSVCWLAGCIASTIAVFQNVEDPITPLLFGIFTSAFTFLIILFVEENIWALKNKSS